MIKIQTLNNISTTGLAEFPTDHYQIGDDIESPEAILVRSAKMHDMPIPASVRVVGRAGAGTNNIPIEKLTKLGIPVMNTPGANANAVKELVITGLLLACRNICSAWNYARQLNGDNASINKVVEKNKKQFAGIELPGRTLGVIGLGAIGVKVANAARNLEMKVIGYDPAMTVQNAWQLRSSVIKAENIQELLTQSDFITLHIPLNDHTRHLIDAEKIKLMRDGAVLLNFARDGIINNQDLLIALNSGKISQYVCDFPNELFLHHDKVISLPHLGASTKEAEENCAVMIAKQVRNFLENGIIRNSVNFPDVKLSRVAHTYRLAIVNKNVPNVVAQFSNILSSANVNIIDMINKSRHEIAYNLIDVNCEISDECLQALKNIDGVIRARKV
jgi:D-3-phosphoglycerate dehydrogenase / 2-oxoglutarate reductase